MANIDSRIEKVLITETELKQGIKLAADWVNHEYRNKKPIIVGILKGCIPFIGQLVPQLTIDHRMDFMAVSSFKGQTHATGQPEIITDMLFDIEGQDILLVEDIVDTARTIKQVIEMLRKRNPKSIKLLTLLDKKEGRRVELEADFACFNIPLVFIVGFGLDYQEIMRNFPYIGVLKEEVYLNPDKKDTDK